MLLKKFAIIKYMAIDWTKICQKYKGLWVGLEDDKITVIASGKTVKEVMRKSKHKGYKRPILFRVPTRVLPYVGGFSLWNFLKFDLIKEEIELIERKIK